MFKVNLIVQNNNKEDLKLVALASGKELITILSSHNTDQHLWMLEDGNSLLLFFLKLFNNSSSQELEKYYEGSWCIFKDPHVDRVELHVYELSLKRNSLAYKKPQEQNNLPALSLSLFLCARLGNSAQVR